MAPPSDPLGSLRESVIEAASALRDGSGPVPEPALERPPSPELGDYSTNAAMLLAGVLKESPRDVAGRLTEVIAERLGDAVDRLEVAGPGFVNLHLSDAWHRGALADLIAAGAEFGSGTAVKPERVVVEFVSANPTGPLTAAGGRHAAFGDALARLLAFAGHHVEREYYINDWGRQTQLFAESIAARLTGRKVPEDGYEGEYVGELAEALRSEGADAGDLEELERRGVEQMVERARATLERFGVGFDTWFSERSLHEGGATEKALAELEASGHTFVEDGALWLRSTEFGDDKDRVLRRGSGETTYLAADVAYHLSKLERGFERMINVLGADHHGYVARLRAALAALGLDPERLEAAIMQLVHVVERGERAQMSKRRGEFVTLDELIGDIGPDAARFFMLQRSSDTALDLDLDLAREQSNENPVYYVQYAHARISSILRKAEADGAAKAEVGSSEPLHPSERVLVKRLLELPGECGAAAQRRAPHRLTAYGMAVAADFHAFYRDCKVVGAEGDGVEAERLALCIAVRDVIARSLGLLGVSAPERM